MSKMIISAFDKQAANRVSDSLAAGGFDSKICSVLTMSQLEGSLGPVMSDLPSIQARLYQKHLKNGNLIFVARVSDKEVASLIRVLQAAGGQLIEAFDPIKPVSRAASCNN
jgi:hypothetical protein